MLNTMWRKTYRGQRVQNWFGRMPHDWGYPMVPVLCWHPFQFVCQTLSSVRFLFCIKQILCSTLNGEKPIGVQGSKIGLPVCPMIGAIQWYQFYSGTPTSLGAWCAPKIPPPSKKVFFFSFSLRFKKYYVQLYMAKNLQGSRGPKLV